MRLLAKQLRGPFCAAVLMAVACGSTQEQPSTHGAASSLLACGPQQACANAAEQCFSTAACGPPPGGCQSPETGELKCHRTCLDDSSCAASERCVAQLIFEPPQGTDVGTQTQLCLPR